MSTAFFLSRVFLVLKSKKIGIGYPTIQRIFASQDQGQFTINRRLGLHFIDLDDLLFELVFFLKDCGTELFLGSLLICFCTCNRFLSCVS